MTCACMDILCYLLCRCVRACASWCVVLAQFTEGQGLNIGGRMPALSVCSQSCWEPGSFLSSLSRHWDSTALLCIQEEGLTGEALKFLVRCNIASDRFAVPVKHWASVCWWWWLQWGKACSYCSVLAGSCLRALGHSALEQAEVGSCCQVWFLLLLLMDHLVDVDVSHHQGVLRRWGELGVDDTGACFWGDYSFGVVSCSFFPCVKKEAVLAEWFIGSCHLSMAPQQEEISGLSVFPRDGHLSGTHC